MPKFPLHLILFLFIWPTNVFSQKDISYKPKRSLITSIEVGSSLYHTKIMETALLVGFIDNEDLDTFEIGYIYKRILDGDIDHLPSYHGIRGAGQVQLFNRFGFYCTYDIISGSRWLYNDNYNLAVYKKIHGEATLGAFYKPKSLCVNFYLGIEPVHYHPTGLKLGGTSTKFSSISFKIKYTLTFDKKMQ